LFPSIPAMLLSMISSPLTVRPAASSKQVRIDTFQIIFGGVEAPNKSLILMLVGMTSCNGAIGCKLAIYAPQEPKLGCVFMVRPETVKASIRVLPELAILVIIVPRGILEREDEAVF
jgi:hypothetical protein